MLFPQRWNFFKSKNSQISYYLKINFDIKKLSKSKYFINTFRDSSDMQLIVVYSIMLYHISYQKNLLWPVKNNNIYI